MLLVYPTHSYLFLSFCFLSVYVTLISHERDRGTKRILSLTEFSYTCVTSTKFEETRLLSTEYKSCS